MSVKKITWVYGRQAVRHSSAVKVTTTNDKNELGIVGRKTAIPSTTGSDWVAIGMNAGYKSRESKAETAKPKKVDYDKYEHMTTW